MKDDTISRAAAVDALDALCDRECEYSKKQRNVMCGACHLGTAFDVIEQLPSAQQERKKGKWIYNSPVTMKCNQCGFVIKDWDWHRFKYCPNCIADMRGESDG